MAEVTVNLLPPHWPRHTCHSPVFLHRPAYNSADSNYLVVKSVPIYDEDGWRLDGLPHILQSLLNTYQG